MDALQKTSRRTKWLLAGSLALNLLFVGVFAGAALRHDGNRGHGGPGMSSYGAPYMQALPRPERRALQKALRSGGALPNKETRRAMYQNVLKELRAEPFDADALGAVMTEQSQTVRDVQSNVQAAWLEAVRQMADSDRLAYADALEERLQRKRQRRAGKKRD